MIVLIKDICEIKSGKRLPKGCDFSSVVTNHPYIRARDIKEGIINTDNLVYISDSTYNKISKYIINTNDIAITVVGASIGDIGFAKKIVDGYNLTENAVRLTNFRNDVNPKYIYYCLMSNEAQTYMKQIAGGSAQPKLGIYKVESIQVNILSKKTQDKIVDIISTYDDLIENNQKQIKLLEESAQRLYKEWFIDFRFPGCENTNFIDGLPEGWEYKGITDNQIFIFLSSNVNSFEGIKHYYATAEVNGRYVDGAGILIDYANKPSRASVQPLSDSIWFARMSKTYKMFTCFGVSNHYADDSILSSGFAGFRALTGCFGFVYQSIVSDMFNENKDMYATGATQVSLTNEGLKKIKVLIPTIDLIRSYSKNVDEMIRKMELLKYQNIQLKQARDLLLPKLMSGEIEV